MFFSICLRRGTFVLIQKYPKNQGELNSLMVRAIRNTSLLEQKFAGQKHFVFLKDFYL